MTARPDAPELSAAELRFLDRPDAPEALRERVARALWDAECQQPYDWDEADDLERGDYYRLADAALAVVRGEQ